MQCTINSAVVKIPFPKYVIKNTYFVTITLGNLTQKT